MKFQSFICKFYDDFLSLHKTTTTEGRIFESVYWILEMCPLFIWMLIVIQKMLICSLFKRINMLRTHLNFVFFLQTNAKEELCLFTCKKVRITKSCFSKLFWIKSVKVCRQIYRRQPRRRWAVSIMLLHSFIEIALLHGGLL